MFMMPSVIETTGRNSRAFDLPTKLLQERIIYLSGPIDEMIANSVVMQMLWLKKDNADKDINLYINSPGGIVYEGYAIKDVMDTLPCKVNTVGIGMCASMGAFLLAAGTGQRKATKNCRIMLHSISGGSVGNFHDMKVDFKESNYTQTKMLNDIASFSDGKLSKEDIEQMTLRDHYMDPQEAIEKGLLDICL